MFCIIAGAELHANFTPERRFILCWHSLQGSKVCLPMTSGFIRGFPGLSVSQTAHGNVSPNAALRGFPPCKGSVSGASNPTRHSICSIILHLPVSGCFGQYVAPNRTDSVHHDFFCLKKRRGLLWKPGTIWLKNLISC
jgi:hypothetical protein